MADNKDARLTLLTRGHGGSLSLIGSQFLSLLHWAFSECLVRTIFGKLRRKLTSFFVRFHFLYHNNIRLHNIRGKINLHSLKEKKLILSY